MADPDANYSRLYTTESDKMVGLSKKRREEDDNNCYEEEENDPVYVFFLSCLKGHGKSYILEGEEKGLPVLIEYEADSGSDEACDLEPKRTLRSAMKQNKDLGMDEVCDLEPKRKLRSAMKQNKDLGSDEVCDLEPKRKLRSAMKQNKDLGSDEVCDLEPKRKLRSAMKQNKDLGSDEVCGLEPKRILRSAMKQNKVPLNKRPLVENLKKIEMVNEKQIKNKCMSEKKRKVKSNPNMETEPDYLIFRRNLKVYPDGSIVYNNGNHTVVYSMTVGKNSKVKEEDNDGSFSGVTILGCSLSEEENLNFSTINNRLDIMDYTSRCDYEFRRKVIAVLGEPYDEEEYERLWREVGHRKAIGGRHLDLRKGRERPCSLKKDGKSYLDHYPGLEIKLLQAQDDKPKCLSLLRGFFFWLKLPGPFCPWEDAECLAIPSESS